jgi:nucleotide-binding universal stress UspA family protein
MYKNILVPTDGSELSQIAVKEAVALAKVLNAKVTGVTVTLPFHVFSLDPTVVTDTPDTYETDMQVIAQKYLQFIADTARAAGVECETVRAKDEHPYRAIIETARNKHCDLIFMASHGRRGLSAVLLGSETMKVLAHCTVPVLVHRAEAAA